MAAHVRITIGLDRVIAVCNGRRLAKEPAVWIREASAGQVLSLTAEPGSRRISLFDPEPVSGAVDKLACLRHFLHELILEVLGDPLFVRKPSVSVVGTEVLGPILAGYERSILLHALKTGGAATVRFDGE